MRVINLTVDVDTDTWRLDALKLLTKVPSPYWWGIFLFLTLRTHSLLTMNKTKKRAQKRAKARRPFIIGFERLSYIEQIKYVRVERRCTLNEARNIVRALNGMYD